MIDTSSCGSLNSIKAPKATLWYLLNIGNLFIYLLTIVFSTNCEGHKTSTNHEEEKYKAYALNVQGAIREQYPQVSVIVKPISTSMDQKIRHLKYGSNPEVTTKIEDQLKAPRIGAFEVQLYMK